MLGKLAEEVAADLGAGASGHDGQLHARGVGREGGAAQGSARTEHTMSGRAYQGHLFRANIGLKAVIVKALPPAAQAAKGLSIWRGTIWTLISKENTACLAGARAQCHMKRRTLLQSWRSRPHTNRFSQPRCHRPTSGREVLALTQGWRFHDGDIPPQDPRPRLDLWRRQPGNAQGAAAPDYDDSDWPLVNLPHDFAASQPIEQGTNVSQGYRRRGMAWYRQSVKFDDADRGRHLELQIDGAATHATVWVNGTLVHHNYSSYNRMAIDLTPYATYGEAVNTIVVRVDAVAMEGWWYEGAGLYREVRIVKRAATHIVTDGVFAHPVKRGEGWVIPLK